MSFCKTKHKFYAYTKILNQANRAETGVIQLRDSDNNSVMLDNDAFNFLFDEISEEDLSKLLSNIAYCQGLEFYNRIKKLDATQSILYKDRIKINAVYNSNIAHLVGQEGALALRVGVDDEKNIVIDDRFGVNLFKVVGHYMYVLDFELDYSWINEPPT